MRKERNDATCDRNFRTASSPINRTLAFGIAAAAAVMLFCPGAVAAAETTGRNQTTLAIPDQGDFVFSPIEIDSAPRDAVIKSIDLTFQYAHPFPNQLNIDLNADGLGDFGSDDVWARKSGPGGKSTQVVKGIKTFNGLPANRTYYLFLRDEVAGGSGALKGWSIVVHHISSSSPDAPVAVPPAPQARVQPEPTPEPEAKPATEIVQPLPEKPAAKEAAKEIAKEAPKDKEEAAKPKGPAPVISSVSPAMVPGMNKAQPFTIIGKNFDCKPNVTLADTTRGVTFPKRSMSSCSAEKIVINPNFTDSTANWFVQVINADGGKSSTFKFKVKASEAATKAAAAAAAPASAPAPAPERAKRDPNAGPVVNSVSPNPVPGVDSPQNFTIHGDGFQCPPSVTLQDLTRDYTFPKRPVVSCSETQIVIAPNFGSAKATWAVRVINKDGKSTPSFSFKVGSGSN